ncbi:MAG: acetyl-CoA synthetase [Gammaproteobacteria bacterium]|nr:acetyl-CoA synthetase [Gammaproteobacteria bacterium]
MNPTESFRAARDFLIAHRTDYEGACRGFEWPRPERFNWAIDWFDTIARGNERTALRIVGDGGLDAQLTFDTLRRRSNFLAAELRSWGLVRGDHVLLMLGNVPSLWELTLACMKLGCPIIPTTTLLMPSDLQDRVARGAARVVITDPVFAERFEGMSGEVLRVLIRGSRPGWQTLTESGGLEEFDAGADTLATDPLFLYFTSGTTAKPKLVVHTHVSYPIGHLSTMYWLGLRPGDRHLNLSSPGWAKHAWSSFFAPWNAEAAIVMVNHARFDAASLVRELARCEVTSFCAPPTVWRSIIQLPLNEIKVSLRELASAGEPLNPEVISQVQKAWGLTIRDGYGQTETTAQIGNCPGQEVQPGSMGRVLPGYRIELLDVDGNVRDEGEICVSLAEQPVPVMPGYLGDSVNTAAVMAGGFYHCGDIARRDSRGYFTYVARNDDVFKCSDYKISPFELESLLIEHEAVVEAAVVPSPDAQRLSVPKAFVILAVGHAPSREVAASILKFVRDRTSPFKRIRRIEFADLPKTVSGKIRRVDLRRAELARELTARSRNDREFWEEDLGSLSD